MRQPDPRYLALDQGGHSSRALAFSADGLLLASVQIPVTTAYPYPTWVEQDATELSASLRQATAQLRDRLGNAWRHLESVGLATQRSNCLCWDKCAGRPLSPVLSWQDRRGQAWMESLNLEAEWLRSRTGLYASPHYGASKLRWCLDHIAAVRTAAERATLACGPLASFLLRDLTGADTDRIDPANAARTLLWNLAARDWDEALLQRFGIPPECLPTTVPTCATLGEFEGLPVRVLTGDQSAALYADGPPRADTLYINLGTGAFLQRPLPNFTAPPTGLLGSVVYADDERADYVFEATVNGAGTALDWVRDQLGIPNIETALAEWLQRDGAIPLFLNGIAGLGSPWWRPGFASRFIGQGSPWSQAVAVAESILFLIQVNLERFHGEAPVRRLWVSGGLSQLDGLCQRLADLSAVPVLRSRQHEATARGVAWLLARPTSEWPASPADCFEPVFNPAWQRRYQDWRHAMDQALGAAD